MRYRRYILVEKMANIEKKEKVGVKKILLHCQFPCILGIPMICCKILLLLSLNLTISS